MTTALSSLSLFRASASLPWVVTTVLVIAGCGGSRCPRPVSPPVLATDITVGPPGHAPRVLLADVDHRWVVYLRARDGNMQPNGHWPGYWSTEPVEWWLASGDRSPLRIDAFAGATADGRVAVVSDGRLLVVDTDTGAITMLGDSVREVSPDGVSRAVVLDAAGRAARIASRDLVLVTDLAGGVRHELRFEGSWVHAIWGWGDSSWLVVETLAAAPHDDIPGAERPYSEISGIKRLCTGLWACEGAPRRHHFVSLATGRTMATATAVLRGTVEEWGVVLEHEGGRAGMFARDGAWTALAESCIVLLATRASGAVVVRCEGSEELQVQRVGDASPLDLAAVESSLAEVDRQLLDIAGVRASLSDGGRMWPYLRWSEWETGDDGSRSFRTHRAWWNPRSRSWEQDVPSRPADLIARGTDGHGLFVRGPTTLFSQCRTHDSQLVWAPLE